MLAASFASSSRLKPEIRLAQAVSEFEAALSGEQKAEFRTCRSQAQKSAPGISDVMRLTAEIDRSASRKGRRCFGPRLTNVLQAVQQFASIGDIIIGGSQNLIACGVWSLVRMTLLTISQSGSYLEKLSTLFMTVGRSAPRYQAMALLFSRSKKLQGYLYEYFIAVVRLCQETTNHSKKSALAQISSNLVDSELKKIQSELELWANSIKEEVTLLSSHTIEEEAKESSIFRGLILKSVESDSYRLKMEAKLRLLDACSTHDYVTTWKQARKKGSPIWFTQNDQYQQWRESRTSGTLYLIGKLGSGKSVLMASMIDDLSLAATRDVTAYFFCRHDIADSLKARTILGCLARQLLQGLESVGEYGSSDLDTDALYGELLRILPRNFRAYRIVLDGLDECDESERQELIRVLKKLQGIFNVLVCISVRSTVNTKWTIGPDEFKTALYTTTPYTTTIWIIEIPANNPDIGEFIDAELETRLESGRLSIGDAAIILEIRDALEVGAQGMFLWVALQMDSICDEKTDYAIRSALKDLPRDLSEIFRRILQKSGQTNGTQYQQRMLRHITAACRPLTLDELRGALSVNVGITIWDPANIVNNITAVMACCGSLITTDEEELTVSFAHHSVVQFLTGHIGDSPEYQFTLDSANTELGHIIVTYLNYGIFDTQVSRVVVPRIPAKETPSKIVDSVLSQSSGVKQIALSLLKSRRQAGYDIGKVLFDAKNSHQESSTTFNLLPYAKEYWYNHTEYIWERNNNVMLSLWCKILQGSQVQVSADLMSQICRRVETFAYYPIYPRGILRLRRVVRIVILAKRIKELDTLQADGIGGVIIDIKGKEQARFSEIVRAVLMETKAAKNLERYVEALKVVKMVKESFLPFPFLLSDFDDYFIRVEEIIREEQQ
ncbi:hypothetical protein L207DRAFT_453033 [Hyaloscypha variabilis F]|uniref:Uncharacterized protein n=1 Tax=Hyaloscypha variabilis (strain UAMH 11265 / GT02V1 / F) TaxID=1149755 RepID=A0A2J6S4Z6_HYAVF|nr:hypothetical protein L207DRAFT_453033 [Hyaloscypha variabilis F]